MTMSSSSLEQLQTLKTRAVEREAQARMTSESDPRSWTQNGTLKEMAQKQDQRPDCFLLPAHLQPGLS